MRGLHPLVPPCVVTGLAALLIPALTPLSGSSEPRNARTPPPGAASTFMRPNEDTLTAVAYLREILTPPPEPPPPEAAPPPPPPPPPPPDIAETFRRQLAAVVIEPQTGTYSVLLVGDSGSTRRLGVGEMYAGGWRLGEISETGAVLRSRSGERRIAFHAPVRAGRGE